MSGTSIGASVTALRHGIRNQRFLSNQNLQLVVDNTKKALEPYQVLSRPVPATSQELAVTSPADVTLYYGNRGGGKSYCMLLHFASFLDKGYGRHYKGLVLGHQFQSLTNILNMSQDIFAGLPGAVFYGSHTNVRWVFRSGEQLLFRHCNKDEDYEHKLHGNSFAWIGIEESTNWATPSIIDKAMSTLRTGFKPSEHSPDPKKPIAPLQTRVFLVTNPSGDGRHWHRDRYIDGHQVGKMSYVGRKVPVRTAMGTKMVEKKSSQVAIFSSFTENPYLSLAERSSLFAICEDDKAKYAQWIRGSWDETSGGALDDIWTRAVHAIPPFVVPPHWEVDRSHDWGSSHPSATVWWARSDGSEVFIGSSMRRFPRGTLFAIEELYTSNRPGYNEGTRASVGEVCQMIKDKEEAMKERGTISTPVQPGPADSSIKIKKSQETPSIYSQFVHYGIHWTDSDSTAGARKNGLQLMRQRLRASVLGEGPGLYVCSNCVNILKLVPPIQLDPKRVEDVQDDSEDHLYDAVRYRVLAADRHVPRPIRLLI